MTRRKTTDLRLAARLAAAGHVRSARAIVARQPRGRVVAAIEVNRTQPIVEAAPESCQDDSKEKQRG